MHFPAISPDKKSLLGLSRSEFGAAVATLLSVGIVKGASCVSDGPLPGVNGYEIDPVELLITSVVVMAGLLFIDPSDGPRDEPPYSNEREEHNKLCTLYSTERYEWSKLEFVDASHWSHDA